MTHKVTLTGGGPLDGHDYQASEGFIPQPPPPGPGVVLYIPGTDRRSWAAYVVNDPPTTATFDGMTTRPFSGA